MTDNTAVLLINTWQEARYINKVDKRNIERITEANETSGFIRSVYIQAASHNIRLVGNNTNTSAIKACKASNDVLSKMLMYFIEVAIINDRSNDILHIIWSIRIIRNDRIEGFIHTGCIIIRFDYRSIFHIVARQEAQKITDLLNAVLFIFCCEMSYTRRCVMRHRTAESLRCNFLSCNGFDNSRASDEHLARVLYHVDKVRDSWRINCTTCARSHDNRDLRDDT